MNKPNCYECKYRGDVPGDAHSSCKHPSIGAHDPLDQVMAILASVGRTEPPTNAAAMTLNIKADPHGVRSGWFNWPFNFDPVWLLSCDGFEAKQLATKEKDND